MIIFFGSFLSEPISLTIFVDVVVLIGVAKAKNGYIDSVWSLFFVCSGLGLFLMLLNHGYWGGITGSVHQFTPGQNIIAIVGSIGKLCWLILFFSLSVCLFINSQKKVNIWLKRFDWLIVITYGIISIILKICNLNRILILITVIVFFLSTVVLWINYKYLSTESFWITLYLFLNAISVITPYIFVSPYGPRAVFPFYILILLLSVHLLSLEKNISQNWVNISCATIPCIIMAVFLGCMSTEVHAAKQKNDLLIRYQLRTNTYKENNTIYYIQIPYQKYWWNPRLQTHDDPILSYYQIPTNAKGKLLKWNKKTRSLEMIGKKLYQQARREAK